ncbi:MAG: trypsin-like peptidase domain-containing protein [Myxococcales bacterium]
MASSSTGADSVAFGGRAGLGFPLATTAARWRHPQAARFLRNLVGPASITLALAASAAGCTPGQARSDSKADPRPAAPVAPSAVAPAVPTVPAPTSIPPAAGTGSAAPLEVPAPGDMRTSVAPLVDRVKGSVVTILSTKIIRQISREDPWSQMLREQFGVGRGAPRVTQQRAESLGSGFLLDATGVVLTNNHVVAGADEVMVRLSDDRQLPARVLGSDPATDVAVVKIDKPPSTPTLPPVTLGDSDRVRVGDYVLAIGNPLGLGQTVTMGIVSAKNRAVGDKLADLDPRYQDFIQTDAAINQGNSGGPLFNFAGQVIGINSAIINPGVAMNVGFAIPINLARQIADQIRRSGRVARGYLGVGGEDFTAARAQELHVPYTPGALVNVVGRGSPAEVGGLRPNDVIVEIGGKPIESYRRLPMVVAGLAPGEKAKVTFMRAGRRMDATVTLGGQGDATMGARLFLGIDVRPLDSREARALGMGPGQGLAVTAVDPRGPASGVLEEGDLLVQLDDQPVTLDRLRAVEERRARGVRSVLVIQRGNARFALGI